MAGHNNVPLFKLPAEITLQILTYLDIPDLSALVSVSHHFLPFSMDPILHRERLLTVAPARLSHFLVSPCRPLFDDLVNRNIAPGLDLLRRWRQGNYLHSPESVKQYRAFLVHRQRAVKNKLSSFLISDRRPRTGPGRPAGNPGNASVERSDAPLDCYNPLRNLYNKRILPDVEAMSLRISRSLLPAVLRLKRSLRRDELKRLLMANHFALSSTTGVEDKKAHWLVDGKGRGIWREDERIRLYVCPRIRPAIDYFESLGARN